MRPALLGTDDLKVEFFGFHEISTKKVMRGTVSRPLGPH